MKPVVFIGDSLDNLRQFSTDARREIGYQLSKVQDGRKPTHWKPMTTVGDGVQEIRIRDKTGIFRVIYLARFANAVYVLHCFQKKTQKTNAKDIKTAHNRYQELIRELQ